MSHERTHKRLVAGAFASFLVALLIAGYMVANAFDTSFNRQVKACERGNDVRKGMDEQRQALIQAKVILLDLMNTAEAVTDDPVSKQNFARQRDQLAAVQFERIKKVDCERTIRDE